MWGLATPGSVLQARRLAPPTPRATSSGDPGDAPVLPADTEFSIVLAQSGRLGDAGMRGVVW
jgi:hypothetical protein